MSQKIGKGFAPSFMFKQTNQPPLPKQPNSKRNHTHKNLETLPK